MRFFLCSLAGQLIGPGARPRSRREPVRFRRRLQPAALRGHAGLFVFAGDAGHKRTIGRLAGDDSRFARLAPGQRRGTTIKPVAGKLLFRTMALEAVASKSGRISRAKSAAGSSAGRANRSLDSTRKANSQWRESRMGRSCKGGRRRQARDQFSVMTRWSERNPRKRARHWLKSSDATEFRSPNLVSVFAADAIVRCDGHRARTRLGTEFRAGAKIMRRIAPQIVRSQ